MDKMEMMRWLLKGMIALAFITGLFCWNKWKSSWWKWLTVYVLLILCSELTGMWLRNHASVGTNAMFYSFFVRPLTFLFFYLSFYRYEDGHGGYKVIVRWVTTAYFVCLLADYLFFRKGDFIIHSFSFSSGTVLLLILLIRFFYRLAFQDIRVSVSGNMMFWFCLAIFIYYLGTFPFFALRNTLAVRYPDLFLGYWYVQMSLSCLMYLLFAFSFIWAKPK